MFCYCHLLTNLNSYIIFSNGNECGTGIGYTPKNKLFSCFNNKSPKKQALLYADCPNTEQ